MSGFFLGLVRQQKLVPCAKCRRMITVVQIELFARSAGLRTSEGSYWEQVGHDCPLTSAPSSDLLEAIRRLF